MDIIVNNFSYFMTGPFPEGPIGGLVLTLYLSVSIGMASFCVGLLMASLSLVPFMAVRMIARGLVAGIRGVPSLAFLFWIYFLIPRLLEVDISPIQSATIALALYHGAFMAEDIRGGLQAVAKGQWEAGRASGLGTLDVLRYIVFPQAIRAVVPALVSRFVNLFTYTSIVSLLGILEFTRAAIIVNNRELVFPIEIFGFIGLVYFSFCYAITRFGRYLERRWDWAPKVGTIQVAA